MKMTFQAAVLVCTILALTGCGANDFGFFYSPPPPATNSVNVFSNPTLDGYIAKAPVTGALTVTQGMSSTVQSVFAGTDPASGAEFRGFLDFPGGVPSNAVVNSAVLNIFINTIQTATGTIPVRIDLVSVPPPLIGSNFDSPALATVSTTISQSNLGQYVNIDVTPLFVQSQLLHFTDFQIRILVPTTPGFVEINDSTGVTRGSLAPFLNVAYSL
jgi:hypothetical protein